MAGLNKYKFKVLSGRPNQMRIRVRTWYVWYLVAKELIIRLFK